MSGAWCKSVYAFMDGELEPEKAEQFREHLIDCDECNARLRNAWMIDGEVKRVLKDVVIPESWLERISGTLRKVGCVVLEWLVGSSGPAKFVRPVLAGAVLLVGIIGVRSQLGESVDPAMCMPFEYRTTEGRLTTACADLHHPFEPRGRRAHLSGGPTPSSGQLPLTEMSKLQERGDHLALAAVYLHRDKPKEAMESVELAGASAEAYSDRAAIHLYYEEWVKALEAADNALSQKPDLIQAQWNRALALRVLGLLALAAKTFEDIASKKEPGWSEEASRHAADLRAELARRRGAFQKEEEACRQMEAGGAPIPPDVAAASPGYARECLGRALAGATHDRVAALLPLAMQLDALDGGTWLSDSMRQLGSGHPRPRPGRSSSAPAPVASKSPWDALLEVERESAREITAGEVGPAIARLRSALDERCQARQPPARPMDIRCLLLRKQLAQTLAGLRNMPVEAREEALLAMRLAQQAGVWDEERALLGELAQIGRLSHNVSLVRGYVGEILEREPVSCAVEAYARGQLGLTYLRALDFERARGELHAAHACKPKPGLALLYIEAELARIYQPKPEETATFRERVGTVRADAVSRGEPWVVDHAEGRYLLEVQPPAGEALLKRTIRETEALRENAVAFKARTYSYTSLILEAGKRQRYEEALDLFAEELDLPRPPQRCALGVTVDDERTLVVVRDAKGAVSGWYDNSRKSPLRSAARLIPGEMLGGLRACKSIDVIARTFLLGMPGMLPADLPWGYLTGMAREAPHARPGPRSLLVTGARPPQELRLEPVSPYRVESEFGSPPVESLQGETATPARVLEALTSATEVRIHAHGVRDGAVSDAPYIALTPDRQGRFALTASEVRKAQLLGQPVVVLIACQTAPTAPYLDETHGLPVNLLRVGARMVFAAASNIPNDEASRFFEPLLSKVRSGQNPAEALMEAKANWKSKEGQLGWVEEVLLFRVTEAP